MCCLSMRRIGLGIFYQSLIRLFRLVCCRIRLGLCIVCGVVLFFGFLRGCRMRLLL